MLASPCVNPPPDAHTHTHNPHHGLHSPQAQLLVKHVTTYHVRVLKFLPFELDHFVSAGRDNIRCYRMRGEKVHGISINMQVGRVTSRQQPDQGPLETQGQSRKNLFPRG